MKDKIIILMATYNGGRYLSQQLDSIKHQTYTNWELYIRDDLSTDDTLVILESYAFCDERIKVLHVNGPHGSPALNFGVLFNFARAKSPSYLMFADQDDVWDINKITASLNFMQANEKTTRNKIPLLIYSKFQFVDEQLSSINQELKMPSELEMPLLLMANYAYGCTTILNKLLIEQVNCIPQAAEYHDYWIALVACASGKAILLPQKLLKYRQHSQNASTNVKNRELTARFDRYRHLETNVLPGLIRQHQMLTVFSEIYSNHLSSAKMSLIAAYLEAFKHGNASLLTFMLQKRFRKIGLPQTLAHFYAIIFFRKKILSFNKDL